MVGLVFEKAAGSVVGEVFCNEDWSMTTGIRSNCKLYCTDRGQGRQGRTPANNNIQGKTKEQWWSKYTDQVLE